MRSTLVGLACNQGLRIRIAHHWYGDKQTCCGLAGTTTTAQGDTLIKGNPAVNQLRAADSQFKSYLIEFGLTPAARSKVHATPEEAEREDPLKEFFGS